MKKKFDYSFADEPISKFCYDMGNKRIEVSFMGYSDLSKNKYVEEQCTFIIENWKVAGSRIGDDGKLYDLNKHIGVFSMILTMEFENDELKMLVSTVDNRYVTLFFKGPNLILK